jgi:hypothetical protein
MLSIILSASTNASNTFNVNTGSSINFEFIIGSEPLAFDGSGLSLGVIADSDFWDQGETLTFSFGSQLNSNDIAIAQITNFNPFPVSGLFARLSNNGFLLPDIEAKPFSSIFLNITPTNGSFDFNTDSGFARLSSSLPGNPELIGTFIPLEQSTIPEPDTWLMMIIGFSIVGLSQKRHKASLVNI